jgi:DnaK suppressor protein
MTKKIKKKTKKKSVRKGATRKTKAAKPARTVKKKIKTQSKQVKRKPVKTTARKSKKTTRTQRARRLLKIKTTLLKQRDGLLKEAEMALNTLPGEINFPDMGDQATAEADRDFMLRLRDRERMLLKKIDEAIERIDNGVFGICENCGNEIGIKRLEARPVTTYCIDCKTRQEEEERIAEGG